MAFYEENSRNILYPTTFFVPMLFGIGLILFFLFLSGKMNFLVPFVPILVAFYLIFVAETNMESDAFNFYYETYGPYLLILAFLWGITFFIHTAISRYAKGE